MAIVWLGRDHAVHRPHFILKVRYLVRSVSASSRSFVALLGNAVHVHGRVLTSSTSAVFCEGG